MRNSSAVGRLLLVVLTFVLVATAAKTPKLTFKFTTIKVKGAQSTAIFGVNNAGAMVGSYVDQAGVQHGFRLVGGKVKKIDDANGIGTSCFGINKAVAIVGYYFTSSYVAHAFLYQKGTFTEVGPANSTGSQAIGINDHGDINGNFGDSNGSHGFLLKGGAYSTIDVPGASATLGGGINNADLLTEEWIDSSNNVESSLYDGKQYTTINVPGETDSYVSAISKAGDIVYSWETSEEYGGALMHGGKFYKFHVPGGDRTWGYGINDHNEVVGAYTDQKGVLKGYSATYK